MEQSRLEAPTAMEKPKQADELASLIYCARWMSIYLPCFAERIDILDVVLNRAYAKSGKRTTKSIKGIALHTLSWGDANDEAFADLKDMLSKTVRLSYPSMHLPTCVFTDASERYWAAVVTQTEEKDLLLPFAEQRHKLLTFLGSAFKGSECYWSTFEKEAFAIFQTFKISDYLLLNANAIHVYTDRRYLLFVYAPLSFDATQAAIWYQKYNGGLYFSLNSHKLLNISMGTATRSQTY